MRGDMLYLRPKEFYMASLTVNYTQGDLDTITKAIVSGTKIVRLNNRTIEYHNISQMLLAKADIIKSIEAQLVLVPRKRGFRVRHGSGL